MNNVLRTLLVGYHYFKTSNQKFESRELLERWQQEQFRAFQQKVLIHSPWYKKQEALFLQDYPVINKKIFMQNFDEINTVSLKKRDAFRHASMSEKSRDFSGKLNGYTVGLSSGTSGNRGIFLATDKERAIWAGNILAKMLPPPQLRKHKIAFFLRANSPLYEGINSKMIKFRFFDLISPLKEHIKQLNNYQPSILVAPAQVLRLLALDSSLTISPEKVISVAEVLEEPDQILISQCFRQTIHQIYQCTEGFLACTCEYGNLHLNEDIVIVEKELLDDEGRFTPVITDLRRQTQPIVRYKLDDILIEDPQQCPCGSVFIRLKKIEGRCDDILIMKNRNGLQERIFPDFIRRTIISCSEQIEEYAVIQYSQNKMEIYLQPLTQEIKKDVKQALLVLWKKLCVHPPEYDFHLWQQKPLDKKLRRIQNKFSG